jgi:hypothetical protein
MSTKMLLTPTTPAVSSWRVTEEGQDRKDRSLFYRTYQGLLPGEWRGQKDSPLLTGIYDDLLSGEWRG